MQYQKFVRNANISVGDLSACLSLRSIEVDNRLKTRNRKNCKISPQKSTHQKMHFTLKLLKLSVIYVPFYKDDYPVS